MHGLLALGPSGPFSEASEKAWFTHPDGAVRHLEMDAYRDAMITEGRTAPHLADDIVRRMRERGCDRVLWACGNGGRRGHLNVAWDARVAVTAMPAEQAVPYVIGAGGHRPVGSDIVERSVGQPGVLQAFRYPMEKQRLKVPLSGRTARALRMKGRVTSHPTQAAHASLAVGHVGATAIVTAGDPAAVEGALARLVAVLVADMREDG
jgi:hypothetical protein